MREDCLYFPTIEFRSIEWLKASLLVWDHVYRIVPDEYAPSDQPEVREAVDAGLVRSIHLDDADVGAAATKFEELIKGLDWLPDGLTPDDGPTEIHIDKIDARLYPMLEEMAGQMSGDWVKVPPEVARGYMLTLADETARRRAIGLATDDPDAWVASCFIEEPGAISDYVYDDESPEQYCHFGFRNLVPVDVARLEMKDIISVVRDCAAERRAFRTSLNDFLARLRACESEGHARTLAMDFRKSLQESVDALKARYSPLNKSGLCAFLARGVPAATSVVGALTAADVSATLSLTGGAGFGVVAAMADRHRIIDGADPVARYFLNAERRQHAYYPNFRARMEEFVND